LVSQAFPHTRVVHWRVTKQLGECDPKCGLTQYTICHPPAVQIAPYLFYRMLRQMPPPRQSAKRGDAPQRQVENKRHDSASTGSRIDPAMPGVGRANTRACGVGRSRSSGLSAHAKPEGSNAPRRAAMQY